MTCEWARCVWCLAFLSRAAIQSHDCAARRGRMARYRCVCGQPSKSTRDLIAHISK